MTLPGGNGTLIPRYFLAGQRPGRSFGGFNNNECRTEHETPLQLHQRRGICSYLPAGRSRPQAAGSQEWPRQRFSGLDDPAPDYDKEEFARIKAAAAKIREDSDVLVVAGIGGSYLGARAVVEAVKGMYHNELEDGLKIYFCGNSISHLPEQHHPACARASASPSTSSPSPAPPPRPLWPSVCCVNCWKRRWAWRKPTSASTPPPTVPRAP